MMIRKSAMMLAVSGALAVAAFAASGSAQKSTVTVGDFAVKLTRAIGHPVSDRTAAVASLKTLGVNLGDANARLTEDMAARILGDLGMHVTTTSPESAMTPGKADQLATIVGLSSLAGVAPATDLPSACLNSPNRGTCVDCCKTANGCAPSPALCEFASPCAKFCKQIKPGQPSPSDPTP